MNPDPKEALRALARRTYKYPDDWPYIYGPTGQRARLMDAGDILGAIVLCPHCDQLLKITDVIPWARQGINPEDGRPDRWFTVALEDGTTTRFWTDNKLILYTSASDS